MAQSNSSLPAGRQGLSLISVLVALALLSSVAVAVSRIIVTSSRGSRAARGTFVATQLAREGLELIRAHRDTNWFKKQADWTADLCLNNTTPVTMRFDSAMAMAGQPEPVDIGSADINLYRTADGQFVHDPSDHTAAGYDRWLTIDCAQARAVLPDAASIDATSTVQWRERGVPRTLELKERLFNWLPTSQL